MISFCDYIKVKEVSAVFRIRLKELRENAGLSQYGFAEKIGISQSTVGNWEAGSREPNFKTMERIADFFWSICRLPIGPGNRRWWPS